MAAERPERPRVAVAHGEPGIGRVAALVLEDAGFDVVRCSSGRELLERASAGAIDAAVVDVGLEDLPGYDLAPRLRRLRPNLVVVLISAVFRKTSYKRRPERLYGADAYVELHHVADHLPDRLWRHLWAEPRLPPEDTQSMARDAVLRAGDARLTRSRDERIVDLVVADALLYAGSAVAAAPDARAALSAAAADLDGVVATLAEFGVFGGDPDRLREAAAEAVTRAWSRMRGGPP